MPLLGEFAPFLVAVMALLAGLALWVVAHVLARLLSAAPIVGGWIAGQVESVAASVAGAIINEVDGAVWDAGWAFAAIGRWAWHLLDAQSRATGHAVNLANSALNQLGAAEATLTGMIVGAERNAENYAAALVATEDGYLHAAENTLTGMIVGAENNVASFASTLVAQLRSAVDGYVTSLQNNINTAYDELFADIQGVQRQLGGDVGSLVNQLQADLTTAEAEAQAAVAAAQAAANAFAAQVAAAAAGTAVAGLDQAAHDVVIGPWTALLPDLGAVAGALDPAVAGALGLAGVLAEPVPVSVPGILSLVVPALGAVTTEVAECLVPNCGPLGQWSKILGGIEDAALWSLLAALVAEVAADPAAAQADITAAVSGLAGPVLAGVRNLVGV